MTVFDQVLNQSISLMSLTISIDSKIMKILILKVKQPIGFDFKVD